MGKFTNALDNKEAIIKLQWVFVAILAIALLMAIRGLQNAPRDLTLHIPPDLRSGANAPFPRPRRQEMSSEPVLATATSRTPSPLKSAATLGPGTDPTRNVGSGNVGTAPRAEPDEAARRTLTAPRNTRPRALCDMGTSAQG